MYAPEITQEHIIVRPLQEKMINLYLDAFSLPVRKALHVTSTEAEKNYLLEQIEQMKQHRSLFYCIFNSADNTLIGAIAIRCAKQYAGQLYSWINEQYWGTGYYQQALRLVAQEYFTVTQEPFFTAQVDCGNIRSYKALKKAGFVDCSISMGPWGKQYELLLRNKKTPYNV